MNEQENNATEKKSQQTAEKEAVEERGRRRVLTGTVISDVNDKTVVVEVVRRLQHPLYKKYIKRSKKYHAHDEANEAKAGDIVQVMETRPMSKLKRWRVVQIVKRAV